MTGSIIGKCLSARDPLHTGSVHKMDGFLHIYLSLCFLKTAAASCDPGAEILFSADALFSTVTLTKPVVTHPARTVRAITFGRSALLHRAFFFFCQPRCRSQNHKPAVPLSGEIKAFFLESDPSPAATVLRMSVFSGVNLLRCMYSRSSHLTPPIGFQFSLKSSFFSIIHETSVSFSDHTFFHSKKPFHDIMCIMSWTACLRLILHRSYMKFSYFLRFLKFNLKKYPILRVCFQDRMFF